jgi:ketosteroid isomerase-like protein
MSSKFRFTTCFILLLLFVALTAPAARSQDSPDATSNLHTATRQELDVIKVLLAQEAAWNRGDIEAFVRAYKDSPDILFISHQVNRGYAGLLDQYRRDYPNKAAMGNLSFSGLEVHTLDDRFAVCIGKYDLDRGKKDGGHSEGLFSLILEKTDQGWKIVVDHTT